MTAPPAWWRQTPPTDFDQGDIFRDVPLLIPDVPANQVEPCDLKGGRKGWTTIKKQVRDQAVLHVAKGKLSHALLLNHGCDLDKPQTRRVTFAYVGAVTDLPAEHHENLRAQRNVALTYLGTVPDVGEAFVDLRLVGTVPREILQPDLRIAAMNSEGRTQLRARLFSFHARVEPEQLLEILRQADAS